MHGFGGGRSLLTIETSSRLILFSTFLGSHPTKTVFYLINRFAGMSYFQGSIEKRDPGVYFKCQGMVRAFLRIRRGELSPLVPWQMELSSWYDGWKFGPYRYS
ncbi:hypothetical protein YC2023_065704 [Brassica napus]